MARSAGPPVRRRKSYSTLVTTSDACATAPTRPQPLSLQDLGSPVIDEGDWGAAPPSPSTLTDMILSLHASLYGAKRSAEEIRDMVSRYYDQRAVFDNPLVTAHGRQRIADQFTLAFALPGLEVRSELRDVICSDFEFDGTRAGLIDHTVTVTLLPQLVKRAHNGTDSHRLTPSALGHGSVTPHPFFNYQTSGATGQEGHHRRRMGSFHTSPQPLTSPPSGARTQSGSTRSRVLKEPLSDVSLGPAALEPAAMSASPADEAPLPSLIPTAPVGATRSHWYAPDGLGRRPAWSFFYDLIHPHEALSMLLSVEFRVFSRLEFNEAGRIVHHEDTWSVRELLEGTVPFLSLCTYKKLTQFPMYIDCFWACWSPGGSVCAARVMWRYPPGGPCGAAIDRGSWPRI